MKPASWMWIAMTLLTAGAAAAQPQQGARPAAEPLSLPHLEQLALERNPTLAQASAAVEAARGRARQAGLLPNPTIGYNGDEISGGPVIRGGEHGIFVQQTVPLGGKLRLSREVFEREAQQLEAEREAQRLRVLTSVRIAFYEALLATRRVEIRERLALVASEAVLVSRQLMNVGASDRPDLLEAEIEDQQARLDLLAARHELQRNWVRLGTLIGDPNLEPRPIVGSADALPPDLPRDAALQQVLLHSPQIKATMAAIERAAASVTRARREPVPDLVVRGGPRYNRELLERGGQPVGWEAFAEVGVTIPLFNRNQGAIAAAQANVNRAKAELERLRLALQAQLAEVFEEYLTSMRSADVYRNEIVPKAELAYKLYLERFREVGAAYPQVLVAQRNHLQVSVQYVDVLERAWRAALTIQGMLLTEGLAAPGAE